MTSFLFRTRFDRMRHPLSGEVLERLVLESVDWVNMVAIDSGGDVVMVRQFRFGSGYATLETPGGMVDPGERIRSRPPSGSCWRKPATAAANGAISAPWSRIRRFTTICAIIGWPRMSKRVAEPRPGRGEMLAVERMSEAKVTQAVRGGVIRHALALSALSRVFELWPRPFAEAGPEFRRRQRNETV